MPAVTHESSRGIFCLLACACLLIPAALGAGAHPQRLSNQEYRFSIGIPVGDIGCVEGEHGFTILLHPGTGSCKSTLPQAHAGVFGDYNTAFHTNPSEVLKRLCPNGAVQAARSGLRLTFPGRASAVCQRDRSNGWLDIYVAAQAGSWPKGFDLHNAVPYIDYTAQLHTRAADLSENLKVFRRILASVRIDGAEVRSANAPQSARSPR